MAQVNFKKLFGVLFTVFIVIIVLVFLLIIISQRLSIVTALVMVVTPLAIRYVVYRLTSI